ncbi:MAG: hypothetical protein KGZ35_06055 [Truepera sp.]|nr:hypothetical protein [Truepera sp.]
MALVFFIDRNLQGRTFYEPLRAAGLLVALHRNHFAHEAADVEWIPVVAERGWIIVTADRRLRLAKDEQTAIVTAKARVVALTQGKATFSELAENFLFARAKIERFVKKHPAPFFAVLSRPNEQDRQRGRAGNLTLRFPR